MAKVTAKQAEARRKLRARAMDAMRAACAKGAFDDGRYHKKEEDFCDYMARKRAAGKR